MASPFVNEFSPSSSQPDYYQTDSVPSIFHLSLIISHTNLTTLLLSLVQWILPQLSLVQVQSTFT
jgi:hypothetical protein